jgi:hypothetical protein
MNAVRAANSQLLCVVIAGLALAASAGCGGRAGAMPSATETPTTVFGHQALELAVGVATQRQGAKVRVETTVLGQDGVGRSDLEVDVAAGEAHWVRSKPCGAGRYCGEAAIAPSDSDLEVQVRLTRPAGRRSTVTVTLPRKPNPERAAALIRASAAALRGLNSLIISERLASGPRYEPLTTEFTYVAPNRLAYSISGAGAAVVIGDRRWDRDRVTSPWDDSAQEPLRVPGPDWRRALHPSVLGSAKRDGRPVWRVSFYDPTTPAWFEVEIDKETGLPLWLEMIAAAHFMTHTFHGFNAPIAILPPGKAS